MLGNKYGIFFYSPYPDWVIEGTYKSACLRLDQDKDITCEVIVKMDDLNDKINNDFYNFDKVLLISHVTFNVDKINKLSDNVYFYSAINLNKNVMLDFSESNNILITPYVYKPKNKEEIFKKLGNEVVLKPNEYSSYGGHLIKEISYDNCPENLDRWIFTKYCGTTISPFIHRRVTCLFGKPIFYFENRNQSREDHFITPHVMNPKNKAKITDDKTLKIACKISNLFSDYFGCGVVGCDFVVDDEDNIFLCEANTGVTAIHSAKKYEKFDDRINCGKSIYNSCKNKLRELK